MTTAELPVMPKTVKMRAVLSHQARDQVGGEGRSAVHLSHHAPSEAEEAGLDDPAPPERPEVVLRPRLNTSDMTQVGLAAGGRGGKD